MQRRTLIALATGVIVLASAGGAAVVAANGGEESEAPITGTDLDKATAAALAHTGQGRVTDTEVGDEESYYELEVTLDDGSQVDVQLDEQFGVVEVVDDDATNDEGNGDDANGDEANGDDANADND